VTNPSHLHLRYWPDLALASPAVPVVRFDKQLHDLLRQMNRVMEEHAGVGLAANQVGVALRLFVYQLPGERPTAVVNPVILCSVKQEISMEGCLSVPGSHWPLGRAAELEYRAQSVDGTPRTGSATGLLAHIFQHEVDHLDGKVLLHKPRCPLPPRACVG
jgi:peptide deformylase